MQTNAAMVAAALLADIKKVDDKLRVGISRFAQLGLGRMRANASGRPGPRHVTGDFKRSMNVERRGAYEYSIGTNAAQANRLENGFNGRDALGRLYHQPPYPYAKPTADWAEVQLPAIVTLAYSGL